MICKNCGKEYGDEHCCICLCCGSIGEKVVGKERWKHWNN